jgi:hypothetical protein
LGREEGQAIWMLDAQDTIKADAERTGGGFSVVEFLDFEGSSVPLHVNDRWGTGFCVLEGAYSFVIADETVAASVGWWCMCRAGLRTRGGAIHPGAGS